MDATKKEKEDVSFALAGVVLCERVLQEVGGVLSLIRVVDHVRIGSPVGLEIGTSIPIQVNLVLFFKNKGIPGKHLLRMELIGPSQHRAQLIAPQEIVFPNGAEEGGVNVIVPMSISWDGNGVYWLDVFMNDLPLTNVPFRVTLMNPDEPSSPQGAATQTGKDIGKVQRKARVKQPKKHKNSR